MTIDTTGEEEEKEGSKMVNRKKYFFGRNLKFSSPT